MDSNQAYSDSKLYLTALAFAVARRWPDVLSNAVDPGWVPTKMGGSGAPDDFDQGYLTQTWLAVSVDPAATVSGRYWHHRRPHAPATEASDPVFQDKLSASSRH
jgi:NAD(P)-dependent dehydrogenase (short-subunit alcohol dehydrogenase family)